MEQVTGSQQALLKILHGIEILFFLVSKNIVQNSTIKYPNHSVSSKYTRGDPYEIKPLLI